MGVKGPELTIPNGATVSNAVRAPHVGSAAFQAPAVLDALTFKVTATVNGTAFVDIPNNAFSGVNDILEFETFPYTQYRVEASGAVGANRVFQMSYDY